MNIHEILPCPNPECKAPCIFQTYWEQQGGYIECHNGEGACGYTGPHGTSEAEAIRLHNAICRQPTPEAAGTKAKRCIHELNDEMDCCWPECGCDPKAKEAYECGIRDAESRAVKLHKLGASELLYIDLHEIASNYCGCEEGRNCMAHTVMQDVIEALTKHLVSIRSEP